VTRIDPKSAEPVGDPIKVGDSPSAVSVGAGSVWVVNNGSNNVSRIET
jgi:DNA-binding beta-propeller fold protein YncE